MVIEKFLFPAPNPSHYTLDSHGEHLFWIPAGDDPVKTVPIPCMLYTPNRTAKYFTIFCHGNGCDIGSMHYLFDALSQQIDSYILAFEYPSYGLCKGPIQPDRHTIDQHAERAYTFVRETLQWPANRILMYGHSIGSGPACHIASTKAVGGLILQSPYTSVNNVIRDKVSILGYAIGTSYWNNLNAMKNIHCPTIFIHGQQDNLISSNHSQTLHDSLTHIHDKQLILVPNADHNSISNNIILDNLERFLRNVFPKLEQSLPTVNIPLNLRISPTQQEQSTTTATHISNLFTPLFEFSRASVNATRSTVESVFSKSSDKKLKNPE